MGNFENRVRDVIEYEDVPPISERNNTVNITDESQLEPVSGGTRTLSSDTGYVFDGTVDVAEQLEFSQGTGLYGINWPTDQINYTGNGTLISGTNVDIMMRNLVTMAPNGTLFDVTGTTDDRYLVQSCAFLMTDNLGTIDGFKVPGTKLTDFTNFNEGLTHTGNPNKVYYTTCPFREASNATALTFDSNFQTDFIQIDNSFFKQFNNNSDGINFDSSATLNNFGIVKGNIFDDTVQNNTVNFDETTVGWDFIANNGIDNSKEQIQVALSGNSTSTTISSSNTYTKVQGTSTTSFAQRFNSPSDNEIQYDGIRPATLRVIVDMTTNAGGNDTYAFALFKNDSKLSASERIINVGQRSNTVNNVSINTYVAFETNDNLELRVENRDATSDITVEQMTFTAGS